jgi:hypothetical protein
MDLGVLIPFPIDHLSAGSDEHASTVVPSPQRSGSPVIGRVPNQAIVLQGHPLPWQKKTEDPCGSVALRERN